MLFNQIIKRKINKRWNMKDKETQYIKRGRYSEFNLFMIEEQNLDYKQVEMLKEY